jgi:membrane associated rhomboid family serine protease
MNKFTPKVAIFAAVSVIGATLFGLISWWAAIGGCIGLAYFAMRNEQGVR